ncbi:hypothetical protein JW835_10680 [bacterium]|nr:hypothetical protein [bacterium]
MDKDKIKFIDFLYVLVQWRKLLIIHFFIVCAVAAAISLIIPKTFKASATILPPISDEGDLGFGSLMNKLPLSGLGLGMGPVSEETSLVLAIINSRTIMETVARRFDLQKRYKVKNMEETVEILRKRVTLKLNDEGTITLGVKVITPYFSGKIRDNEARILSRDITNFFIEAVDSLNRNIKVNKANRHRLFIEKRYQENINDLQTAEEALKKFQEIHGTVALPEQTVATVSAAAELEAQILEKEIELNILKTYVDTTHTKYLNVLNELNQLRKMRVDINKKPNIEIQNNEKNVLLPLELVPELGLEYFRLYREVKIQETILEFIMPQYEQAKIQESKDTPTIQVLDKAVKPDRRIQPKRALIVIISGFMCIVIFMIVVHFSIYIENMKTSDPALNDKLNHIFNQLKPRNLFKS